MMTTEELTTLRDLLRMALDDEGVAGQKVTPTGAKRSGTDLVRALDAVQQALTQPRTGVRRVSTFSPVVTVDDDGVIDIDWADCFDATLITDAAGRVVDHVNDGDAHSNALDAALGPVEAGTVARLRSLAEYIEVRGTRGDSDGT